jgi:hypothetical protein
MNLFCLSGSWSAGFNVFKSLTKDYENMTPSVLGHKTGNHLKQISTYEFKNMSQIAS